MSESFKESLLLSVVVSIIVFVVAFVTHNYTEQSLVNRVCSRSERLISIYSHNTTEGQNDTATVAALCGEVMGLTGKQYGQNR